MTNKRRTDMKIEAVYDLGVKLDNDRFGTNSVWGEADEFLRDVGTEFGLNEESAGTGFGVRDMQYQADPDEPDLTEVIMKRAEEAGVDLDYCLRYFQVKYRKEPYERFCPVCKGPLDEPANIEQCPGTLGDEVVYSYNLHYECPTCPDVLGIIINVPGDSAKDGPERGDKS